MSSSSSSSKGKAPAVHSHAHDDHDHDHSQCGGHHDHSSHSHAGPSNAAANDDENAPAWPVVTAEEIEDDMEDQHHFMDNEVVRRTACISDMAGMESTGMGIHRVILPAGRESTILHSHLGESEWIYILSGRGTLVLARPAASVAYDLRPAPLGLVLEETAEVKAGDFAGFPAGPTSQRWAHKLHAGNEDLHYLLGGDRKSLDVISYPTRGETLIAHEPSGGEATFKGTAEEGHDLDSVQEEDEEDE